jgi:hypothetical protein
VAEAARRARQVDRDDCEDFRRNFYVGDTVRTAFGDMGLAPASNVVPINAVAGPATRAEVLATDEEAARAIDQAVLGVVGSP